eukprot:3537259-Pleurochrysis_carterae.AAC.2
MPRWSTTLRSVGCTTITTAVGTCGSPSCSALYRLCAAASAAQMSVSDVFTGSSSLSASAAAIGGRRLRALCTSGLAEHPHRRSERGGDRVELDLHQARRVVRAGLVDHIVGPVDAELQRLKHALCCNLLTQLK